MERELRNSIIACVLSSFIVAGVGAFVLIKFSQDIPKECCDLLNGTIEYKECKIMVFTDKCGKFCHLPNGSVFDYNQTWCVNSVIMTT